MPGSAKPGRTYRLVGLTDYHHSDFGLADMMQQGEGWDGPDIGNVELEALARGPGRANIALRAVRALPLH